MKNANDYTYGLLSLTLLLIISDDEISEKEHSYLRTLKLSEGITDELYQQFQGSVSGKNEKEIYQIGIDAINRCPEDLRLKIFVKLYQLALADNVLHTKEVRLLLYAVKITHVDINRVVELAKAELTTPVL